MQKRLRKTFKYIKKHSFKVGLAVFGFVLLASLLQLSIFNTLDEEYQKGTSSFLYVNTPELSPVVNVYLNRPTQSIVLPQLEEVVAKLRKKSTDKLYVILDSGDLYRCQDWKYDFSKVTFVFRDQNINQNCFKVFRDKQISYLSFSGNYQIADYWNLNHLKDSSEFSVDLGQGEQIFVQDAISQIYKDESKVQSNDHVMNYALAFARIPQVDAQEVIDNSFKNVNFKGKAVFVGLHSGDQNDNRRPLNLKSATITDDYYLSATYFHIKEDAFLNKASSKIHYAFIGLVFLQVLLSVIYFNQFMSTLLLLGVALEVLVITAVFPVMLNIGMPFGHGVFALVFSLIYAQMIKRYELEKVVKRTQKLLSARSLFNNQLLNNKKSLQAVSPSLIPQTTTDFDKYFTKLDVVDSVHGVVLPEVDTKEKDKKDSAFEQPKSQPIQSLGAISKIAKDSKSEDLTPKKMFVNVEVKKTVKPETTPIKIARVESAVSVKPSKIFKIKKEGAVQETASKESPKPQFKILKEPQKITKIEKKDSPNMVKNFQTVFTNNLKRKNLSFQTVGDIKVAPLELDSSDAKKRELFFEALCMQVINDSVNDSIILFTTHQMDDYVVYILKNESLKQFDYKEWLKNAAFFQGLATDLKKQGVTVYQNRPENSNVHELAVGFKVQKAKATKVA